MLGQILKVIKLLGLPRAARMKKHHDQGLRYIRGYTATCCWWTLLNNGFIDELLAQGQLDKDRFIQAHACSRETLDSVIEYLEGIGLLACKGGHTTLTRQGQALAAEPRGLFELLWAYEPCFSALPDLLNGQKAYGRDLTRRVTYVGMGSGRLCEQLPYPVMRRMVLEHGSQMVLDLGCGDMAFLAGLCQQHPEIRGHGLDVAQDMIAFNQQALAKRNFEGRLTCQQGDMFALPVFPHNMPGIDCITACDTFHEYLHQPEKIVQLLRALRGQFPKAMFVVGEFCLQSSAWLRKHPTASLEHHLFHQLSNQQIGTAQQWRDIFHQANLTIVEEQIYDLIGHGYFALR